VFYYLTYAGAVNLETIKSDHERAALEAQIQEFGQTPMQIFFSPHPSRNGEPVEASTAELPEVIDTSAIASSKDSFPREKGYLRPRESDSSFALRENDHRGGRSNKQSQSMFENWSGKTVSFLDRAFGSTFSKTGAADGEQPK